MAVSDLQPWKSNQLLLPKRRNLKNLKLHPVRINLRLVFTYFGVVILKVHKMNILAISFSLPSVWNLEAR